MAHNGELETHVREAMFEYFSHYAGRELSDIDKQVLCRKAHVVVDEPHKIRYDILGRIVYGYDFRKTTPELTPKQMFEQGMHYARELGFEEVVAELVIDDQFGIYITKY